MSEEVPEWRAGRWAARELYAGEYDIMLYWPDVRPCWEEDVDEMAGFGPFDQEKTLGLTEFGGGAGLVEGSPLSQSGRRGIGVERIENVDEVLPVDERIGVVYRIPATADVGDEESVDPQTGLTPDDV